MLRSSSRFFSPVAVKTAAASVASVAAAALLLAAAPQTARAQVTLLSNLSAGTSKGFSSLSSGGQQAVAFTTGSTAYTLNSVQAYLFAIAGGGPSLITIGLFTPSTVGGSDPGTSVGFLFSPLVTATSPTLTTFVPASGITLAANTRYVLLADYAGGANGGWSDSSPNILPSAQNGSGFSDVVYRTSTDNGQTYTTNTDYNLLAINGTAIAAAVAPEPGTLPLLGMGLVTGAGMVGTAKRRRKAKPAAA